MAIINNLYVQGASRFLSIIYASGINVSGATSFGGGIATTTLTASDSITGSNWFVSTGATGWRNSAYGGGWYQNDSTYIRNYGNKSVLISSNEANSGSIGLYLGTDATYYFKQDGTINAVTVNATTLGATTTNSATVISNDINTRNLTVTNNIHAVNFDLQSVAQLGGAFYVSPTYKNSNTATLTVTKTGQTLTLAISDSTITSTTIAGAVWKAQSKVKVSANIGQVATGTLEGTVSSINATSHVLTITIADYDGGVEPGNYAVGQGSAGTFSDLTVMLYERYDTPTDDAQGGDRLIPVGIWMNCYDTSNNHATIRVYGGTTTTPSVLIGNLAGTGLSLIGANPGYGLYGDNVFLKGKIVATAGSVGGFELSDDVIKTAGTSVEDNVSNAVAFSSADFTRTVAGSSRDYLRFAIGANYGIDKDGILYASSAHISGDISVTSGSIYLGTYDQTLGYPFSVTNAGVLNARSGTIAGWTIDPNMIYNYATIADYGGVSGHDVTSRVIVANGTNAQHDFLVVEINDQGTYTYPFVVHADGELWATNAHITGAVTATSGTFTGTVNANSGSFGGANGFVIDTNKIYSNSKSSATSTNNGIYIGSTEGIYLGAYNSTNTSCPFQVTNAGVLKSTSGTIGGWTIDSTNGIYKTVSNTTAKLGNQTVEYYERSGSSIVKRTKTILGLAFKDTNYNSNLTYDQLQFNYYNATQGVKHEAYYSYGGIELSDDDGSGVLRSTLDGYSLVMSSYNSTGGTQLYHSDIVDRQISTTSSTNNRTIIASVSGVPTAQIGTGAAETSQLQIYNSKRNIGLHVNSAGDAGVWDNTKSAWIYQSILSTGNVSIPHALSSSSFSTTGAITATGAVTGGSFTTTGAIASGSTATNGSGAVYVKSPTRTIALHANAAGNAGLYDTTNSTWIIRSETSQGVYIPHNTYVSGDYLYLGTTAATNSPNIICANNKNNVALSCTQSSAGVYHHNGSGSSAKWLISITTAGVVTANTSDIRYKNIYGNIDDYEATTMLGGLDVINFTYKEDTNNVVQNGFKAQQIRDLLKSSGIGFRPYLDIQDVSGEEPVTLYDLDAPEDNVIYSVDYSRFTPLLVKGWQIHDKQIVTHDDEIALLKEEIAQLREEIAELRAIK